MISTYKNIRIEGIVSCVPSNEELNVDLPFEQKVIDRVANSSGISKRRICKKEILASDLSEKAALTLLDITKTEKEEIGVLVFVTQFPDYLTPSTANLLQSKLGLNQDTVTIQINQGCAGFVYGLQLICSLLKAISKEKGLLLVGDTTSKVIDDSDTDTKPIFGDASSASLIIKAEGEIKIELGSDGNGFNDIIIKQGGFREPTICAPSLEMNGMNVFMFGISKIPKHIQKFVIDSQQQLDEFDYLVLHQANKLMNERIVRKIGFPKEKSLSSLEKFGNTSGASIPLTITSSDMKRPSKSLKFLVCGFGVGLSWGTASFIINQDSILKTIEY